MQPMSVASQPSPVSRLVFAFTLARSWRRQVVGTGASLEGEGWDPPDGAEDVEGELSRLGGA